MKNILFLSLVFVSQVSSAGISEKYANLEKKYVACVPPSAEARMASVERILGADCAYELSDESDQLLNEVYREVMARQKSPEAKKALLNSQRAWITYRDAEIVFARLENKGGMFEGRDAGARQYFMTMDRIVELGRR